MLGVVVGLAIGCAYAASLLRGLARIRSLPPTRALMMIQFGSLMRLAFAVAAFALAKRLLPQMNAGWGALAALVIMVGALVRLTRQGARA